MNITIKNTKIMESLSDETMCFTATGYVNGVKAFNVENRGHGGCNFYQAINRPLYDKAVAFAMESRGINVKMDSLDYIIDDLVIDYQYSRDLKRLMKKVVMIEDGKAYTFKAVYTPEIGSFIQKKYPNGVILNGLPFEEALAKYRVCH